MQQIHVQPTEFVLGPSAGRLQGALAIVIAAQRDASLCETVRRQAQEEGRALIKLHLADHLSEASLDVLDKLAPGEAATILCGALLSPSEIDSLFAETWMLCRTLIELLTTTDRAPGLSMLAYALGEGLATIATDAFSRHDPCIAEALQRVCVQHRHHEAARLFRQEASDHPLVLGALADFLLPPKSDTYQQAAASILPALTYLSQRKMFGAGIETLNACALGQARSGQAVLFITLDDPDDAHNELCHRFLRQRLAFDPAFINIPTSG